ncbi:MAG: NADH-quinone oxidoreductase subunit NuoE [Dehalococcoidales bacterium]|nr:NADH-quinone oxidoreductase subunit NuoE [Dehalococcoidales bacterium]
MIGCPDVDVRRIPKIQEKTTLQNKEHGNLLVRLQEAQRKFGCIPQDTIVELAQSFDVPVSEVYGVATFYSFLAAKPRGRNVIRICRSLPCYLKNSQMIIETLQAELGIKPGETTADNRFSFELTNCIGACDGAPAMLINSDVHRDLTPPKIAQILKAYQ